MTPFFIYILKWALCLAMLYIPFAIFLKKETFATFNRRLLLGIIAASALLPLTAITYPVEVFIERKASAAAEIATTPAESANTAGSTLTNDADNKNSSGSLISESQGNFTPKAKENIPFDWESLFSISNLTVLYIIGAAIAFLLRIIDIARITRKIRRGTLWTDKQRGMTIHCHADDPAPFSWFGHAVISLKDYNECGNEILLHEEGHYRRMHSWDMLLLSIVKSLQWFNPFAYLLAGDMKEIHEFEADRHVLMHHGDARAYQLLLLRKAVGEKAFSIANNFGQSDVRRRITMMARKPSEQRQKGKVLSFAPMAALFLILFAEPEYIYRYISNENPAATVKEAIPAQEKALPELPPIEGAPLPLLSEPARRKSIAGRISQISIKPIEGIEKLSAKYEEHGTKTHCEFICLNGMKSGEKLRAMNIKRCNVKMQFIADKEGKAHSITNKGCNIAIAGNGNSYLVEESRNSAYEIAKEFIIAKEWHPVIKDGEPYNTIYDAQFILHFDTAPSTHASK